MWRLLILAVVVSIVGGLFVSGIPEKEEFFRDRESFVYATFVLSAYLAPIACVGIGCAVIGRVFGKRILKP